MSEETCVLHFHNFIKSKFEGSFDDFLFFLKSGGDDDVLTNQVAEYLMVN